MGILNVTPDSFSDGGRYLEPEAAVAAGREMMADGADLIDVGGQSTRPGADTISAQEELDRVVPVVRALTREGFPVSIDTMKPEVAREALGAGAFLINDVSGLRDPKMLALVHELKPCVCIMHMKGEPATMQAQPHYDNVIVEVIEYLVSTAESARLPNHQIWLDPGFGFGKTIQHNLSILKHLDEFVATGYPILLGVSRKSTIGKIASATSEPLPVTDRLPGTLAVQSYAQMKGAKIIRAHDVKASAQAIRAVAAIENAS
jgi:dihydropteroate synthase